METKKGLKEFQIDKPEERQLAEYILHLVPHSYLESNGTTLKVLVDGSMAGIKKKYFSVLSALKENKNFLNVRNLQSTSHYSLEAELKAPIARISRIEFHFNKDY